MKIAYSKDGTAIAFDQTGAGPPLIMVGGAFSYRKFPQALEMAELLGKDFTVINYDRRGRGDSDDSTEYSVRREVEDLEALVTQAGGSAYVYGMSSGAALALEAAASGVNIRKLALYEPPFMVGEGGHRPPADHQEQLAKILASGNRSGAVWFFLNKVMGIPWLIVFGMRLMPFWSKLKAVAHTLPYDAAIMGDFSLPAERLASVTVPTIAIGGEKSPAVLVRAVKAVAETVPNAQLQILEGQSHNVSMKALAPVVSGFFSEGGRQDSMETSSLATGQRAGAAG